MENGFPAGIGNHHKIASKFIAAPTFADHIIEQLDGSTGKLNGSFIFPSQKERLLPAIQQYISVAIYLVAYDEVFHHQFLIVLQGGGLFYRDRKVEEE